jgi:hypothetical protein
MVFYLIIRYLRKKTTIGSNVSITAGETPGISGRSIDPDPVGYRTNLSKEELL